jgi:cyclic beta-1,2-glucan glucanotransferase
MDLYLDWMPALALLLGILVGLVRPHALPAALPILLLWVCSKRISAWLNRPPVPLRKEASKKELLFLRRAALHTWRYFAEFSASEHHWLIPDNVQEQPPALAARMSPTNLGLLLNARQVACEFGYLTVAEFAEQTLRTLESAAGLRKFRGHLLNWYDTRTLEPLAPQLVSSVDSGNLLASLWTLQQGCLDRLRHPIVQPCLSEGLLDHLRAARLWAFSRKQLSICEREQRTEGWLQAVLGLSDTVFNEGGKAHSNPSRAADLRWFAEQSRVRLESIRNIVRAYAPWLQPEFVALREDPGLNVKLVDNAPLSELPAFLDELDHRLDLAIRAEGSAERASLMARLRQLLPESRVNISRLIEDLRTISGKAGQLANDMDFGFLLDGRRKLMSVGFEVESGRLHTGCYDLLATESRTAVFAAIAKEDIPQESWFLLGRAQTLDHGRPVLLSWTGTAFEYLMPSLWMQSYPNTLLDRSRTAVVRSQQAYALGRGVPWGISESAYFKFDDAGNYQYHAFGLPHLALHKSEVQALVISPYSTFLALDVDPSGALRNLGRMSDMGWFGSYGFYEAADYSSVRRRLWQPRYQLVRCWMAHHQGMTLLALANFLHNNIVQQWFHSDRRVQATELLLHERPVSHLRRADAYPGAAAA